MKFSIRDLLLVTVIVALAAGWRLDHWSLAPDAHEMREARKWRQVEQSLAVLNIYLADESGQRAVLPTSSGVLDDTASKDAPCASYDPFRLPEPSSDQLALGIGNLRLFPSLQRVSFDNAELDDRGLKELCGIKSLIEIDIGATLVTDAGVKELSRLPHLKKLRIGYTELTDLGMADIAKLKSLSRIGIAGTSVTDRGLSELRSIPTLEEIDISHTPNISDAGIASLRKALPKAKILRRE